jgi:hypothetical protein
MALWAASSDFGVGAVIAWVACMLAAVAAKVKSPRRASYKVSRPIRHEEPECLAIPIVRRELTLNGDPLQRVRKFKRVDSNLVVWLESIPAEAEIKAPLTWKQWGRAVWVKVKDLSTWSRWGKSVWVKVKAPATWSRWGKSVWVKVKAPATWSQWGKSLMGRTPPCSKPSPAVPVRTKVIMPWDTEKKVWKLTGKKSRR